MAMVSGAAWCLIALVAAVSAALSVRRTLRHQRALTAFVRQAEAAAIARHLELAGGAHACCGVAGDQQCGLMCGHQGDHVPYVPGGYMPPPLLTPLMLLGIRLARPWLWRCPLCSCPVQSWSEEPQTVIYEDGGGWRPTDETRCQFWPCGCEARRLHDEGDTLDHLR